MTDPTQTELEAMGGWTKCPFCGGKHATKAAALKCSGEPASTCGYCSREGVMSLDQRSHEGVNGLSIGSNLLTRLMRFHCSCGNEWLADARDAEAQGRFLDKAGLR